jgi:hypothetical protein
LSNNIEKKHMPKKTSLTRYLVEQQRLEGPIPS